MTAIKTSISLDPDIWTQIKDLKNRSSIINQALAYFLSHKKPLENHLKKAEKDYWDNVAWHIENNTGEYFNLNEPGKTLTQKDLDEKLWT